VFLPVFEKFLKNFLEKTRCLGLKIFYGVEAAAGQSILMWDHTMTKITTSLPTLATLSGSTLDSTQNLGQAGGFLDVVNNALKNVSGLQAAAAQSEAAVAAGVPGVSLGQALVNSDRAEVAWTATVAVRDEVVSAYQAIMNMQF
jgi:flagellar hook-basal body complex protein FliE